MLFLSSMGETGLSHDIFLKFSLRPFEVIEVEWRSMLNFDQIFSKIGNWVWKFGCQPRKGKVDLCMTNGSKVLIYLTLLYFLLHYLQVYSKRWNIAKSNKSELWNRLSYRSLPYLFEVGSQTFRPSCQFSKKFDQNSTSNVIQPQWPRKA